MKDNADKIAIIGRLKQIRQTTNLGTGDFARGAGIDPRNYSSIENGKRAVGERVLRDVCNAYNVDINWLLTGEGDMLNTESTSALTLTNDKVTLVPLLPISAQGGTLHDFVLAVNERNCEKIISPIGKVDFAITVSGDSMAPEFPSGSQVLIKKINERAFIDWGRTYVLDTCNGTVIKKLMPSDSGDSALVKCVSINPAYPPFEVNLHDVYGIYRVMLVMAIK
ncbi:MAG TPA: helix-turn-helix domain-containing protein [Candidatus Tidjanibacter faecipullorum]|uniref:Helix-turn-helix domain-containing protein n=1 Tax=Candidatus Tidjanibacter faecipullorum TaxID=2838766 RepID=A0A9D2ILB1_9BACT|nr:helix-turn-helix domain-containing protein [Candidatus Tidjanibacter faecipullorum]